MKIKFLNPKSRRVVDAGCISGRPKPLTITENGDLVFSHEQAIIDEILKIGSVQLIYYEIKKYSYEYLIFKGSIVHPRNRQHFVNSMISLKHLKKLGVYGNFPNINNPRLESPPDFVRNLISDSKEDRITVANRLDFARSKEYRILFKDPSIDVLINVAKNPEAVNFPEFAKLFKSNHIQIKIAIAKNPNATKFKEFKELFKEPNYLILIALAKNPKAVKFKEYYDLFSNPYFSVRSAILINPSATQLPEYYSLIPHYLRKKIIKEGKIEKEMMDYPEFLLLFKDPNPIVRVALAYDEIVSRHAAYELLFTDPAEEVRAVVASCCFDPKKYREKYIALSKDPSFLVRLCLFLNIEALDIPDLREYIESLHLSNYIRDPESVTASFSYLGAYLFNFKLNLTIRGILEQFASNPRYVCFADYHQFFLIDNFPGLFRNPYLHLVAMNPNAPIDRLYLTLFSHNDLVHYIAINPNAIMYQDFNSLMSKPFLYFKIAGNINAPFCEFYRKLFDIADLSLLNEIMENPNANKNKDFNLVVERKQFLEDLFKNNKEIESFFNNSSVISRFVGNYLDMHVSLKSIERFRHYLLNNPSFLKVLTPSSAKKLVSIGLLKLLLKKEPGMILDIFTSIYLGRSTFLGVLAEFIDDPINRPIVLQFRQKIESNIAFFLPKYNNFEKDTFEQMEFFKDFDNSELRIKDFIDLIYHSGLSFEKIYRILIWSSYSRYTPYLYIQIPKKSGGIRKISIPISDLKKIQCCIKENILDLINPHSCVYSFQKNKNPTDNALHHISDKKIILIKIDLKDYFPNIRLKRVYQLFRNLKYNHDFSLILAHFCTDQMWKRTKKGLFCSLNNYYLPQGAPTSPQISNLVFADVDLKFERYARANNLKYSRYADDLVFSTENLNADIGSILPELLNILKAHKFQFNKKKIQVLRPNVRQSITGIVVNNGIHAKKEIINRIRGLLYLLKNKISNGNPDYKRMKQQLNGLIAYLNTIEPDKAERYWIEYQKLN